MSRVFPMLGMIAFFLVLSLGLLWAGLALWVQLDGGLRVAVLLSVGILAVGMVFMRQHSPSIAWAMLMAAVIAIGGWYQTLKPRDDRMWDVDVSRGVKAQVAGDFVTLTDIRDFHWISDSSAEQRWISKTYDLSKLQTVDMFTSTWSNPNIAHLLVSFGFDGGEQQVFSVEIRREKGEAYSELGGFFRQFEIVLIGATERDIVQLRTTHRKEQVRRYPVLLDAAQRRELFLSYVQFAQDLENKPQFYNTLTANCTTAVYRIAKVLRQDLPLDWRLLLSGHLPAYLHRLGVLGYDGPLEQRSQKALVSDLALGADPNIDFSTVIRQIHN